MLVFQNVVACLFWQVDFLAVSLQTVSILFVGTLYSMKTWYCGSFSMTQKE